MEPLQPKPNETQYQTSAPEVPNEIPLAFRDDDSFRDEITAIEPNAES